MVTTMVLTTTAAPCPTSSSRLGTPMWQTPNAAATQATRVIPGTVAGYATGGFAAQAVAADKHSRQAKPAAPPRGSR